MEGLIVFTLNVKSDKPSGNKSVESTLYLWIFKIQFYSFCLYREEFISVFILVNILAVLFHSKRSDGNEMTCHLHLFIYFICLLHLGLKVAI